MNTVKPTKKKTYYNPVPSLLDISIMRVVANFDKYMDEDIESLKCLPSMIKNTILKKFTSALSYSKIFNIKQVLSATIDDKTCSVNLTLLKVDDEMLDILGHSKNIKRLFVSAHEGNSFTSEGLIKLLMQTNHLDTLLIDNCRQVNDDVLECLAKHCPNISTLDLSGCMNISDAGIEKLAELKRLYRLSLSRTGITNKGVHYLAQGPSNTNLRHFKLENCKNVSGQGLLEVVDNCPNILNLMFHNCSLTKDVATTVLDKYELRKLRNVTFACSL